MFTKFGFSRINEKHWQRQTQQQAQQVIINGQPVQGPVQTMTVDIVQLPDAIIESQDGSTENRLGFRISINGTDQIDAYVSTPEELMKDYFNI
jgi:hypothetical protein